MPARLVPLTSGAAPPIVLERPVILIGRHPECDIPLNLPQVSRRHCCVAQASDRLVIRDLGSRNGIRVNGLRVDEVQLRPGDEVAIAHLLYRLDVVADAIASPRAPSPPAVVRPSPGSLTPAPSPSPSPSSLPELPAETNDPDRDLIPLSDLYRDL
jgi:predicted component of type VI protein secretion system